MTIEGPASGPTGGAEASVRAPYSLVFQNREIVSVLIARLLSVVGDQIARITLALLVLQRSHSAFYAAIVLAITWIPPIFASALLGSLADRMPRRTVMVLADGARTVIVAVLALLTTMDTGAIVLLLVLFAAELFSPPALAARSALMPDLARSQQEYVAAAGLAQVFDMAGQVIGFVLGGLLLSVVSASAALLFDAGTFAVSMGLVLVLVAARPAATVGGASARLLLRDLRSGWHDLLESPPRRALVLLGWGLAFSVIATDAVALPYARAAGGGSLISGFLLGAPPAGALIGILVISRLAPRRQVRMVIPLATISTLPLLATAWDPPLRVAVILWFVAGLFQGYMVTVMSMVILLTPTQLRGRVGGVAAAGFNASTALALVLLGGLADLTTPSLAVVAGGIVALLILAVAKPLWPSRELDAAVRAARH